MIDYTTLSPAGIGRRLDEVARDARATFGGLDERQLNWKPEPTRWSVGQCFEHLLTSNRMMLQAAETALNEAAPRSVWQRLPILPGVFGPMLIRSQGPAGARKVVTSPKAQPTASGIAPDVIDRFVDQHRELVTRLQSLDADQAARRIMSSPFASFVTYSVLDGWRLLVAHDRRHFEQARRVMESPEFPRSGKSV